MKNYKIDNLEDLLDRNKFADLDVALHYGDKLLKNINEVARQIEYVMDNFQDEDSFNNIINALKEAKLETRMMQIAVTEMKDYITGYKVKIQPAKTEDIGATEDWGFTEEELKKLEKYQQPDFTPEEKAKLERYDPKKFKQEN
jgi:hypothetical protein